MAKKENNIAKKTKKNYNKSRIVGDKMKKYVIKSLILVFISIFVIMPHFSYATEVNLNITDTDAITNDFNPANDSNPNNYTDPIVNSIVAIVNRILWILQAFGGFVMVISLALFGYGLVLSGNKGLSKDLGTGKMAGDVNTKYKLLDYGRGLLIGSVLLFSATTLVRLMFNVFMG